MNVAIIIPARKGSSYHRKNLQLLSGIPLVRYTLEASKISHPHSTIVTTDDPYIVDECSKYNTIIDNRPGNLADDQSTLDEVMQYIAINYAYDIYVCLPPTSPLRNKSHVEESIVRFLCSKADSLVSVTEERRSIWTLDEDNFAKPIVERTRNRQQEKPAYISNGAIFISKRNMIIKNRRKVSGKTMLYVMDNSSSVDIHTQEDIKLAEILKEKF